MECSLQSTQPPNDYSFASILHWLIILDYILMYNDSWSPSGPTFYHFELRRLGSKVSGSSGASRFVIMLDLSYLSFGVMFVGSS